MTRITLRALALSTLFSPLLAQATDFDSCEEFFLAPIFLSSHAGTGGELQVGDVPRTRVEVRAKIEGKKDAKELLVTPENLVGDIAAIGPLWPEKGSVGQWLPVKVGDTIDLRVIGYPARKETELGKFRIHLGKLVGEHGYALFNLADGRVFALNIAVSSWDGSRHCKGGKAGRMPSWSMPTDVVRARPARAMLEAIKRTNQCAEGKATPECDLASYVVEYRDVDGDKKVDALITRTLPDGTNRVSSIWMRDARGDLAPVFDGRCDGDPIPISVGVVRCDEDRTPGIIDFRKGNGKRRVATPEEARALSSLTSEEHAQEAIGNLRGVEVAETMYRRTWHHFTTDWVEMAFIPERGNFYSYYLTGSGKRQQRSTPEAEEPESLQIVEGDSVTFPGLKVPTGTVECKLGKDWVRAGIRGEGEKAAYTALAAADLEGNGTLDCWSVSSAERTGDDGTKIPPGQPYHHNAAKAR